MLICQCANVKKSCSKYCVFLLKQKIIKRIFITGSSDGLGKMAARMLIAEGHKVVVHVRNQIK